MNLGGSEGGVSEGFCYGSCFDFRRVGLMALSRCGGCGSELELLYGFLI